MLNILKKFYFSIILIFSIIAGLVFYEQFKLLAPLTTIFLMLILFLSILKLNSREFFASFDEKKEQFLIFKAIFFILIVLPITVYFITDFIYPTLAAAFFILLLAPTGITNPFLADVMKGNKNLALVLTISTSILAPLTIPFLITIILGNLITVSFIEMFYTLTIIIFIPFIFAWIIKYFFSKKIDKISNKFNNLSTIFLAILLTIIIATHSERIKITFSTLEGFFYLIPLFLLFIFIYIFTRMIFYKEKNKDNLTIVLSSVFMNFVLMIVIADKFFYEYNEIIIPIILSVIPWIIFLIIFKQINDFKKNKKILK